jgi:hypothetical protein
MKGVYPTKLQTVETGYGLISPCIKYETKNIKWPMPPGCRSGLNLGQTLNQTDNPHTVLEPSQLLSA